MEYGSHNKSYGKMSHKGGMKYDDGNYKNRMMRSKAIRKMMKEKK